MQDLVELWITADVVLLPVRKSRRRKARMPRQKDRGAIQAPSAPEVKAFLVMPSMRALFTLATTVLFGAVVAATQASPPAPGRGGEISSEEYIEQWKGVAIQKMKDHGIPASITLAQGLLESRSGNSELAREANNHFGIKCTNDWDGGKTYHDDDKRHECFRKYSDAAQSFEDHSRFLQRSRYAALFELRPTDYKGWAHGLKKAGYATDPRYPAKLIDLIERYQLHKLDEGVDLVYVPPMPGNPTRPAGSVPANDNEDIVVGGRLIELFEDRIKFIRAKEGDSYRKLADELEMMPGQLARYNDQEPDAPILGGQVIYLQPKRGKSRSAQVHVAKEGETLWSISQQHGLKLEKLAEYNGTTKDAPLSAGQHVLLKKSKR